MNSKWYIKYRFRSLLLAFYVVVCSSNRWQHRVVNKRLQMNLHLPLHSVWNYTCSHLIKVIYFHLVQVTWLVSVCMQLYAVKLNIPLKGWHLARILIKSSHLIWLKNKKQIFILLYFLYFVTQAQYFCILVIYIYTHTEQTHTFFYTHTHIYIERDMYINIYIYMCV